MSDNPEVNTLKAQAFDLIRGIFQAQAKIKEWQTEVTRLEGEIHQLEASHVDS